MENRIIDLEIKLTEAERVIADLSDIVADQAMRLERAEKRVQLLLERAAEAEAGDGAVVLGDPPPHY